MEYRLGRIESAVESLDKRLGTVETDMRIILGAMIAGFLGLAWLLAQGFGWLQ